MKKILILISGFMLLSCNDDFMDQVTDYRLTFAETFSKRSTAEQYLANVYSQIPSEMAQRYTTSNNSGPWTGGSDEAEYVWSFHMGNFLNQANWNATTQEVSNLWSNFYRGIRSASTFIQNIDQFIFATKLNEVDIIIFTSICDSVLDGAINQFPNNLRLFR